MLWLITALSGANAAGLDLLEVGGPFGSPGATDATAVWWNPAGLAAGYGTRFTFELAPTIATVNVLRNNPTYAHDPDGFGPAEVDYGGRATYRRVAPVPYLGVASDFGVDGLGVGIGLAVPHARGAALDTLSPNDAANDPSVTRHHLIEGGNQALYLQVAGAYEFADIVSIGVVGAFVDSSYNSNLYSEAASSLNDGLEDAFGPDTYYSDTIVEDRRYASEVNTDSALKDSALTFGAGIHVKAHEKVSIAAAYRHGLRVDHTGTATLQFDCPPTDDFQGRIGAEVNNICDATLAADMAVGYNLPGRIHGGVVVRPVDVIRLEAMGGYVFWNVFTDYEIDIRVRPDSVDNESPEARQATAEQVSQSRLWARDQRNSFWLGLDGKFDVHEYVMLGGRVLYDKGAVPTNVLGPNNYDANTVSLSGLVVVHALPQLDIGLSATQYIAQRREVTDSAFGLTINGDRNDVRYFYPAMNGTFTSSITRIGITIRGQFGKDPDASI
jgi:long-subunit fatty acid transport protein